MFPAASIKFLEDFLKASGPSGFEFEQAAIFRKYLSKYTNDEDGVARFLAEYFSLEIPENNA